VTRFHLTPANASDFLHYARRYPPIPAADPETQNERVPSSQSADKNLVETLDVPRGIHSAGRFVSEEPRSVPAIIGLTKAHESGVIPVARECTGWGHETWPETRSKFPTIRCIPKRSRGPRLRLYRRINLSLIAPRRCFTPDTIFGNAQLLRSVLAVVENIEIAKLSV